MAPSTDTYPLASLDGLNRHANGVSVVIASYRAPNITIRCLESIASQTLDPARYEVILVVNGPQAGDVSQYETFAATHPDIRMTVIRSILAGPSHPLNLGISAARMPWMTVVDDDDTVTPRYLEGLLSMAAPRVIPLTTIADVHRDGTIDSKNPINEVIGPLSGKSVPPQDCLRGLTFNTAKLIPTDWARHIGYDVQLKSGQDVAFYGALFAQYDFRFAVVPKRFNAVYLRSLTDDSVSRRDGDFDFSVLERLDVIETLDSCRRGTPQSKQGVLATLQRSQASFMRRYLDDVPGERRRVNNVIQSRHLQTFPWEVLTAGAAKKLVVSVCFPPYADPSAVTVAKRISQAGIVADVLSCDMSAVRQVDPSLKMLASGWVDSVSEVTKNMPFSDWSGYREFVIAGWNKVQTLPAWPYDSVYSRAMWPASHVLAAYIKAQHPNTRWIAEFSDPLARDVRGHPRPGSLPEDELVDELIHAASTASGLDLSAPTSVFELAELLPYALADEIVFTNEHQLTYMLSYADSGDLAKQVASKAVVSAHPVPAADLYHIVDARGPDREDAANLAYFGSFYVNRSLRGLIGALRIAPSSLKRNVTVDVFTANQESIQQVVEQGGLEDTVSIRPTVDYLEFLNLTTKYDCLIVEDALAADSHGVNPYLPSKWSDYRGSGTAIWAFTENGSTLSGAGADYMSYLGDSDEAANVLSDVVSRFSGSGEQSAGTLGGKEKLEGRSFPR